MSRRALMPRTWWSSIACTVQGAACAISVSVWRAGETVKVVLDELLQRHALCMLMSLTAKLCSCRRRLRG